MIMNRSRYKNRYFKNRSVENWESYKRLRNECVKLTEKVMREYFENLYIKKFNDNKKFGTLLNHFSQIQSRNVQKSLLLKKMTLFWMIEKL